MAGCPDGYLPNGNGMCCNPFSGDCVSEGGGVETPSTYTETRTETRVTTTPSGGGGSASCPDGYLPNGQGSCCNPFTGDCVSVNQTGGVGNTCITITHCIDYYTRTCDGGRCTEWAYAYSSCESKTECGGGSTGGGGPIGGGGGGGSGGGGGNGGNGNPSGPATVESEEQRQQRCSSVYNVWALSVEAIKQIHKNSSISCAAGIGILDGAAAATTYENGGKFSRGPWAALVWSLSLFDKLDEMYNCLRQADERKGIDLDILWDNYQAQRRINNCN